MAEFDIPLLTKLLLFESRTFELVDNTKAQFQLALLRLTYTRYSWRLIRLMFKLSPRNTIIIILGRFLEGIIPSIDLRIKGEFLDIVQAAVEKKPFRRSRLYRLGALQVFMYFFSSTFTDFILNANAHVGTALAHHLQMELLRSHLRLSIADLQDSKILDRYYRARGFSGSGISTLLGPLHLFQDLTAIAAQTWTLNVVLREKGRKANALIALSCFNPLFRILYDRVGQSDWDEEDYRARRRKEDFLHLATSTRSRAEISTFGLKDWVLNSYERISLALQQRSFDASNQLRVKGSMRGFVRNLTEAMSYILVATRYSEDITLASLSLLKSASSDILVNLEGIYDSGKTLLRDLDSMKNYFDFLDPTFNPSSTPRLEPFASYSEPTGRGMKIVAKDVGFKYPRGKPVLKGINFTIEPGELIAIVGGNGSGKSTLVKLLSRLYDATSGSIEINDNDIRRYDKDELWSHMSSVNQDFGKYYSMSIGENIGIGDTPSMKDNVAISTAAEIGGALDFVKDFPDTFQTVMANRYMAGSEKNHRDLSGGQWQRLALSRTFMRISSADLLLLDEPSASLDPEAEFQLFKKLKELRRSRTTVYISHRFNTVRAATRIMVIEKGLLVEFGTHEELMALQGRYNYLYGLQTDALADEADPNITNQNLNSGGVANGHCKCVAGERAAVSEQEISATAGVQNGKSGTDTNQQNGTAILDELSIPNPAEE